MRQLGRENFFFHDTAFRFWLFVFSISWDTHRQTYRAQLEQKALEERNSTDRKRERERPFAKLRLKRRKSESSGAECAFWITRTFCLLRWCSAPTPLFSSPALSWRHCTKFLYCIVCVSSPELLHVGNFPHLMHACPAAARLLMMEKGLDGRSTQSQSG